MTEEEYYDQQRERVYKNYQQKHAPFKTRENFANWYVEKLKSQQCECFYCKTSIHAINDLIDSHKLKLRKVRGEGVRGRVLEIDKEGDTYDEQTCVLACYYCNNDKSYTTNGKDYLEYFGKNRKRYFDYLLNKE